MMKEKVNKSKGVKPDFSEYQIFQSPKRFDNKIIEMQAVEILREVKSILDQKNIKYWLDSGTLLGAIRDNHLIPWDNDIDIGVWHSDLPKVYDAIKGIQRPDFEISYKYGPMSELGEIHLNDIGPLREIIVKKNGIEVSIDSYALLNKEATRTFLNRKISIFKKYIKKIINLLSESNYRSKDKLSSLGVKLISKLFNIFSEKIKNALQKLLWRIVQKIPDKITYIPASIPAYFFEKFLKIKFYEIEFNVPKNFEEYLSFRYGEDWRIPKTGWIHYENDGSCIYKKERIIIK